MEASNSYREHTKRPVHDVMCYSRREISYAGPVRELIIILV